LFFRAGLLARRTGAELPRGMDEFVAGWLDLEI
jgi:hypothetical protein